MYFKQFYNEHLSQASYLIGCQRTGEAMIIDPVRDLSEYIKTAEKEGLRIDYATETHIHADFASGIRDAAEKLNATIFISGEGNESLGYRNIPEQAKFVKDGDVIQVGYIKIEVLHTPGHTPESISFLLTDEGAGATQPMGLFTGDFIFVGDIGRPDLLEKAVQIEGSTAVGAKQMYQSIARVRKLPDFIQIWPGHGAGSPCGKSLGAIPMTTLGYEKQNNWAFNQPDENTFITTLTTNQPEPPKHFAQMKQMNQYGGARYEPYLVSPSYSEDRMMIDLRSAHAFHGGHVVGAINIPYNQNFINQIGWYLDYDASIDLIGDKQVVDRATKTLQLIGYDNVAGYKQPQGSIVTQHVHSKDFIGDEEHVLDVRTDQEWHNGHLPQAVHVPHGQLKDVTLPFNKEDEIYVHCQSGVRSSIAVGLLEAKGYYNVINIREGYIAFSDETKNKIVK
ncbi:persulfide dioxygenase-sulfurtransferase CstB [Staphylococcus pseudintermedius]|uniref:persulfide dioxygenase-sulfurtransferase CstB n=1 Tax=Staphylococcus pseudintermedius TaxID=283734 RepID=UPI0018F52A9A|nr:persulfide dioxygenase-sulfurtransferase CstB [Staphylococcus pseudintermedius]MBJ8246098.1 persulfide dioxygenase-sulfurtransferase CstB [Staphylococcus pseudintermedius]MBJ8257573.1 persulfide dioxygenase-sulfurtransferase CstB [Staphylococcus pseudintermedius]